MQVTQESPTTHPEQSAELPGPIELCHRFVRRRVCRGDIVIDATVGNGHDTLLLADLVGPDGIVYGFDIQDDAIETTGQRLIRAGFEGRVRLVRSSHDAVAAIVDPYHHGRIAAAMFNLGYRPGGDKRVVTQPRTTVSALEQCLSMLGPKGIVAVVVYVGHDGAMEEASAVIDWCRKLDPSRFLVTSYGFVNRPKKPPFAMFVQALS